MQRLFFQPTTGAHAKLSEAEAATAHAETMHTDLTISKLNHCVVDLFARPQRSRQANPDVGPLEVRDLDLDLTAVHIRDVKDSLLLLGYVRGSVLVHNLERCTVVVACHQLRVHSSHETRFHLHVASNAVIEDCSSLTFGAYLKSLPLPADVRLQKSTHDAVQDFSHLKNTPSPHWSVISNSDLELDERWLAMLKAPLPSDDEMIQKTRLEESLAWTLP
ncbi:hypothetical protein EW145_g5751 [Phellinidium pouzarii]|uniref:C-CAP/cofactor C-like domain-containing protein n=1 Tax=Phellinidium pouzarii TaxID=167371 RepID=A0A4S4KZ58_9AGAM|nr:hypothetical protein EW145_g5751 [Phellinidium pouzarii]